MTYRFDRRDFLRAGVAGLAAASFSRIATAADVKDPYLGLKMGVQSFSLRGFKVEEALEHTKTLGLKYWEAFPGHIGMGSIPKYIEEQKAMLAKYGVTLFAYGVIDFDDNEAHTREKFEFAKAMGIKSLSAGPKKTPSTFDLLDKMVAEYGIAIAIHNHGPKATFDKISDVETFVKDRHPLIGACVDTGHFIRSNEDPVEAIQRLGKRVFGVHLKDFKAGPNGHKIGTIAGEGELKIVDVLKALKAIDYQNCVSIEYEENEKNPVSDIEACLRNVREAAAKIG